MVHYSVKPIRLTLQRSHALAALFATVSLGACAIFLCMPVHPGIKIITSILVAIAAVYTLMQHAWLNLPWSYHALEIGSTGELQLLCRNGTRLTASILPDSFVHPWLTIVNVRLEGSRWRSSVLLTPDRVETEPYRQLRVWLRWGRHDWRAQDLPEEEALR